MTLMPLLTPGRELEQGYDKNQQERQGVAPLSLVLVILLPIGHTYPIRPGNLIDETR